MKFEDACKEFELIVKKLEDENLPLDEGKLLYEKGVELTKFCHDQLNDVNGKVTILKDELEKYIQEEN